MVNTQPTIKLHYVESGQGMPVVLLHGFPFDHRIWQAQQAALSTDYRVIAPDLRGHGQSPVPEGVYSMDAMAADVIALLDQLGIEKAVWVGHSMGGYITMAALRYAPSRFSGMVLVATQPLADTTERRVQRLESAKLAEKQGSSTIAFSMMGVLFSPTVEGGSPMAQGVYEIMVNTPPMGVAGALRGMADRPDSTDTLRKISIPTLVIAGREDQIIKLDIAEQMAANIPAARLVTIEGSGHLPMIEKPDETIAALREFLKSLENR